MEIETSQVTSPSSQRPVNDLLTRRIEMQLRRMLTAATLTLCLVTVSYGGTITGGRTTAAGSRTALITGSRSGLITGSKSGTITGGRVRRSPDSETTLRVAQAEFFTQIIGLLFTIGW
jgi:hypothetical protein